MNGIVGTAGHIDHGKTALIGALTGEETDRLPEERRRGISIDLGFSHLEVEDARLGIVDVPGHEDFIRNMLAGATGIDVLLLVVAADEGVMPQTREHTAIAELLGVHRAVVALTKVDLVDDDWLGLVHDDLADFLADTPFAGAPIVPTSAVTGAGLDELRDTLGRVFTGARGRPDDLFRMPIDRAFTVRGTGTVVTGTVWGGRLQRDESVRLLPDGPEARVRTLQVHGREVESVEAGERAAIALAGTDRSAAIRGMTLVTDDGWAPTHILTVRLRVLPATGWSIEARQRVRVHLGTAEVMARVVLLEGAGPLAPGQEAWAQLRLEEPLVARVGDRLVVRSYSPVTTIGGGVVAEPTAGRRSQVDAAEGTALEALLGAPGPATVLGLLEAAGTAGVLQGALPVLSGASPAEVDRTLDDAVVVGDRAFHTDAAAAVRERILAAVGAYHEAHHLEPGMDPEALRRAAEPGDPGLIEHALDALRGDEVLVSRGGRVARSDWEVTLAPAEAALRDRIAGAIAAAGHEPPRLDELLASLGSPEAAVPLLELLELEGGVVRLEHDLFMDASTLHAFAAAVRERFAGRQDLAPSDFRAIADVSRRHLMPLLAYLDRVGITVRSGDGRSVPA